jgi:hypothetical protein
MEFFNVKNARNKSAKEYIRLIVHSLPLGTLCQWLELPTLEGKADILQLKLRCFVFYSQKYICSMFIQFITVVLVNNPLPHPAVSEPQIVSIKTNNPRTIC